MLTKDMYISQMVSLKATATATSNVVMYTTTIANVAKANDNVVIESEK